MQKWKLFSLQSLAIPLFLYCVSAFILQNWAFGSGEDCVRASSKGNQTKAFHFIDKNDIKAGASIKLLANNNGSQSQPKIFRLGPSQKRRRCVWVAIRNLLPCVLRNVTNSRSHRVIATTKKADMVRKILPSTRRSTWLKKAPFRWGAGAATYPLREE